LSTPLSAAPGTEFSYSNINSQLAGLIIERATGKRYAAFLSNRIWRPIGASDAALWLDRPGRQPALLLLPAGERARLGAGGPAASWTADARAGGKSVPGGLDEAMATPSATNPNYGLQLWIGSPYVAERRYSKTTTLVARAARPYLRPDVLFLDGATGQRVYVVPSERLVIVRIGQPSMTWDDSELPNRILAGLPAR
jgi:CubicO group peptidase (beta-lactamase class C family)